MITHVTYLLILILILNTIATYLLTRSTSLIHSSSLAYNCLTFPERVQSAERVLFDPLLVCNLSNCACFQLRLDRLELSLVHDILKGCDALSDQPNVEVDQLNVKQAGY